MEEPCYFNLPTGGGDVGDFAEGFFPKLNSLLLPSFLGDSGFEVALEQLAAPRGVVPGDFLSFDLKGNDEISKKVP